jgi:hypothetical protein
MDDVENIPGVGKAKGRQLRERGFNTIIKLANASLGDLAGINDSANILSNAVQLCDSTSKLPGCLILGEAELPEPENEPEEEVQCVFSGHSWFHRKVKLHHNKELVYMAVWEIVLDPKSLVYFFCSYINNGRQVTKTYSPAYIAALNKDLPSLHLNVFWEDLSNPQIHERVIQSQTILEEANNVLADDYYSQPLHSYTLEDREEFGNNDYLISDHNWFKRNVMVHQNSILKEMTIWEIMMDPLCKVSFICTCINENELHMYSPSYIAATNSHLGLLSVSIKESIVQGNKKLSDRVSDAKNLIIEANNIVMYEREINTKIP